jgi:cytochrome P450
MAADLPLYLLLAILLGIPLILFATASRPRAGGLRLPPGPWALPVIGHLHHLAGALPHRALRDLARRHGPLMMLRLGELSVVVASSPDAAREVMLELAYRGARGVVFAPYGEGWRQLRKICALELLSARRVQYFRPVREGEVGRLLRSVAAAASAPSSSPVNLSQGIAAYVADSTVRAIIGSRFKHRDAYLRMLQEGLKIVPGMTLPDLFPSSRLALLVSRVPGRIERHRRGMQQFIDTIITEHRENRASAKEDEDDDEDLLDVLLRLQKEVDSQHPLTTENIKTVMLVSSFSLIPMNL